MRFHAPQLQTALEEWRSEPDAKQRAAADNVHFEERSPPARQAAFEAGAADAETAVVLRRRYADYHETFVTTADLEPHTFQTDFVAESLGPVDDWQPVIRLESLRRGLGRWGGSFADLQKALSDTNIPVLESRTGNIKFDCIAFAA